MNVNPVNLGGGAISMSSPHANIDYLYGPYESLQAAKDTFANRRFSRFITQGLTIGVIEDGKIVEYQWKTSLLGVDDLEKKIEDFNLSLELVGADNYTVELGLPIIVPIKITGLNGIQAVLIYQIVSGKDVSYQTILNVAKDVVYNLTILPPDTVGNYAFKIMVIDTYSKAAKTSNGLGYIQIDVKYGSILVTWNFSEITNLSIKNASTVAEKDIYGTFNALLGYQVNKVSLVSTVHGTETLTGHSYQLQQNVPLNITLKITMPNTQTLTEYEGEDLRIKIDYKDSDGVLHSTITDVICALLSSTSISFQLKNTISSIYEETPVLLILNVLTGNGTTLVNISSELDSDFSYAGKITSYIDSSIYITSKKLDTSVEIQNGAFFKFRYTFLVNNTPVTGIYTIEFPNAVIKKKPPQSFYIPTQGSNITKYDLVNPQTDTKISDGIYYKNQQQIIISSSYNNFLLDLYCKLNKTDVDTTYVKIEGLVELNWVELAQINDNVISIGGGKLNSFTPVNDWKLIGIGYLLTEDSKFIPGLTVYYNAIYIDGILVKNIAESEAQFTNIRITFNNVLLSDSFIYYNNASNFSQLDPLGNLSDSTDNYLYSIIYLNYKSHDINFSEPGQLPMLNLTPLNENNIDDLINKYSDENVTKYFSGLTAAQKVAKIYSTVKLTQVRFGTVADGLNKASSEAEYISPRMGTLFNLTTDLKKALLKKYGVLCVGTYNGDVVGGDTCIIQVNTQGTSTLNYAIPNFKFKFFSLVEKTDSSTGEKSLSTEKVKINTLVPGYKESTLTAKADYMDSSHLNNTPTCIYYNNVLQRIKEDTETSIKVGLISDVYYKYSDMISPSANKNKLDAILGIPIIINVNETVGNEVVILSLGSFMLNIDKTGDSLGFDANKEEGQEYQKDPDNNNKPFCLSFEGTSNDNDKGLSSRFINGLGLTSINNVDSLSGHTGLTKQWCQFFSEGLEYRFPEPDSGIYSNGSNGESYMPISHFKYLYKMWSWVELSAFNVENGNLSRIEYKTQFLLHFNLLYCMLYFIDLMIFGLTDNLGKNTMWDTWDGEIWYPRPYDLDSEIGLDNNGNDEVPSFVEIKPEFSLDYDSTKHEGDEGYTAYKGAELPYEGSQLERYHFSSENSNLWLPFYTNFKTEINQFYYDLRTKYNYTPESIIENAYNSVISKLGVKQYNIDFNNKYLGSDKQEFAFGNRWTKFLKWIKDRFAFCDSYFDYFNRHLLYLSNAQQFTLKVGSPQYVRLSYEGRDTVKLVISEGTFGGGSGAATQLNLSVADSQLVSSNVFSKVKSISEPFGTSNLMPYLVSIDARNSLALSMNSLINTSAAENLSIINISNSSINALEIGASVKKVLASECSNLNITTTNEGMLEELDVHNSTFRTPLTLNNLPNLKVLNIKGATLNGLNLAQLPNLTEILYDSSTIFGGTFVFGENVGIEKLDLRGLTVNTLNITSSSLKVLDCRKTKFLSEELDISTLGNIEHLLFNGCTGLKWLKYVNTQDFTFAFNHLKYFGLKTSSIKALGTNNTIFDCSSLSESILSTLKTVIDDETSTNNTEYNETAQLYRKTNSPSTSGEENFKFERTQIETIDHLIWKLSGYKLFYNCSQLVKILNSTLNIISSAVSMFELCRKFTFTSSDETTITISNTVSDASYAFSLCDALDYSYIEPIIETSTSLTVFHGIFQGKMFNAGDTINLAKYSHATDMNSAFSMSSTGGRSSLPTASGASTVQYTVSGTLPATVTDCSYMFYSVRLANITNFSTFLSTATNLTNASSLFLGWLNQVIKVTSNFFSNSNEVLENISGIFANTKVYCDSDFRFPSTITTATGVFYNSTGFTENTDVTRVWANCNNLTNIGFAFYGCPKVYASGIYFNSNSKTINTTGLFGLSAVNSGDAFKLISLSQALAELVFKFEVTGNNITLNSSMAPFPGSGAVSAGMFERRYVPQTNILSKIDSGSTLYRLFYGATTHFTQDLNINVNSLQSCYCCFSSTENRELTASTENLVYINIKFKSGTSFLSAFSSSLILKGLVTDLESSSLPSTTTNTSSMYASCKFATVLGWNGLLPANYFEKCSLSLTNAASMFANCDYLKTLEYSPIRGLFSNCTNLVSEGLRNIFQNAGHLLGGIPSNLFGIYSTDTILTNLTDLSGMFYGTSIFYKIDSETFTTHCITIDTFKMVPNVTTMNSTFARIRCYLSGGGSIPNTTSYTNPNTLITTYSIHLNAFSNLVNLSNINSLFYLSSMVPNLPYQFGVHLTDISDAFYDTRSNSGYLTFAPNVDSLKLVENATNTFGTFRQFTGNNSNIDSFVEKLLTDNPNITATTGIVYQRTQSEYASDVSDKYMAPSNMEQRRYDGREYEQV